MFCPDIKDKCRKDCRDWSSINKCCIKIVLDQIEIDMHEDEIDNKFIFKSIHERLKDEL